MKSLKIYRKIIALSTALGLMLGFAACSNPEEKPEVTAVQASDGGGAAPSDGGGTEGVAEPAKQMPDVIAAIQPPDKADYPELGGQSRAAANDHAKYFMDTMLYGYATGDSAPFAETFDPLECNICQVLKQEIDQNAKNEYYANNYPKLEVHYVEFLGFNEDEQAVVFYEYTIPQHSTYEGLQKSGEVPGMLYGAAVTLKDYGEGWVIKDVETSREAL